MRWGLEFLQRFWRWAVVIDIFALTYVAWTAFRGSMTGNPPLFELSALEFVRQVGSLVPLAVGFATLAALATLFVPRRYVERPAWLIAGGLTAVMLAVLLAWQGRVWVI